MSNIRIDGQALWADLMETARFGGTEKGGIKRLTLTEEDRQVRDWFASACTTLGCTMTVDSLGNMFARLEGQNADLPPITMGSHLDTQPTGGKFDGILGVLGGLAVLRALREAGHVTRHPVELINWTNEEGSRFSPPMMCSGAFAGAFSESEVLDKRDRAGDRFGNALDAIGYRGKQPCGDHPVAAYFELHIEQGPILEAENRVIGAVTGVQGIRWYEVTLTGRDAHAGSTPMTMRADTLLAASTMIVAVSDMAKAYAPEGLGTVGLIENRPNSHNVIPGETFFTIDLRHPDDTALAGMEETMKSRLAAIAEEAGVALQMSRIWDAPAVPFDRRCIDMVAEAAKEAGFTLMEIVSGPGHDAAYLARITPTAMIFVPCRDGLSHNEAESITETEAEAGANVLLGAILRADRVF